MAYFRVTEADQTGEDRQVLLDTPLGFGETSVIATGLSQIEAREITATARFLGKQILRLEVQRGITSEEANEYRSWAKFLLRETRRLSHPRRVRKTESGGLRMRGLTLLKDARKLLRFPAFLREQAAKRRSTSGLRLISRFSVSPPVIRVHQNEAARISFIVAPDIVSIDCSIFSPERGQEVPPAYCIFRMNPTAGYHVAIWDGTFEGKRNQPPVTGTYRVRIVVKDRKGRKEEVFDQIRVLNPRQRVVLPRNNSGLALQSLHFDGVRVVLSDERGNAIHARAVSGLKPHHRKNPGKIDFTRPEFQWVEDNGPLPESRNVPGGKYFILQHSVQHPAVVSGKLRYPSGDRQGGTVEAWGPIRVPLHPFVVEQDKRKRSQFFVHIDTNNDGTAGCIGIHPSDEGKFNQMMSLIALMPNDKLPVTVAY